MKRFLSLTMFIATLCLAVPSFAQWTQAPGNYYAKAQVNFMAGSQGFDLDGDLFPTDDFAVIGLGLYAEYGLTSGTTFTLNASPISTASYGDESTLVTGPITLGSRNKWFQSGPVVLSSEGRIGIEPGSGDKDLAIDEDFLFVPSRGFGLRFEGVTQFGLGFNRVFFSSEFGARFNWYEESDVDLIGSAQFGVNVGAGFTPVIFTTFNWNLDGPEFLNVAGTTQSRYVGLGLGVGYWPFERIGFSLTAAGAPYAVSNAGAPALAAGIQFR